MAEKGGNIDMNGDINGDGNMSPADEDMKHEFKDNSNTTPHYMMDLKRASQISNGSDSLQSSQSSAGSSPRKRASRSLKERSSPSQAATINSSSPSRVHTVRRRLIYPPDPAKQREREERFRIARERQEAERLRRIEEIREAQRRSEEFRQKQQEERLAKLRAIRQKDSEHRALVEERKKRKDQLENEKRQELVRRSMDRDSRKDNIRAAGSLSQRMSHSTSCLGPQNQNAKPKPSIAFGSVIDITSPRRSEGPGPSKAESHSSLFRKGPPPPTSKTRSLGMARSQVDLNKSPRSGGLRHASSASSLNTKSRSKSADPKVVSVTSVSKTFERLSKPKTRPTPPSDLMTTSMNSSMTSSYHGSTNGISSRTGPSTPTRPARSSTPSKSQPGTPTRTQSTPPSSTRSPAPKSPATNITPSKVRAAPPKMAAPAVPRTVSKEASNRSIKETNNKVPSPTKGPVRAVHSVSQPKGIKKTSAASKDDVSRDVSNDKVQVDESLKPTSPSHQGRTSPSPPPAASKPASSRAQSPPPSARQEEEEYKAKIAAKRKEMREKAEKEAEEKRLREEEERRAEEERLRQEEEEQRRMEEEQLKLVEELRKAEEERLQNAIREEEERKAELARRAEAEAKAKAEAEEAARLEAARKEAERLERMKKEEEERLARKKRLESIMSRVKPSGGDTTKTADGHKTPDEDVMSMSMPSMSSQFNNASSPSMTTSMTAASGTFRSPLLQKMLGKKKEHGTTPLSSSPADSSTPPELASPRSADKAEKTIVDEVIESQMAYKEKEPEDKWAQDNVAKQLNDKLIDVSSNGGSEAGKEQVISGDESGLLVNGEGGSPQSSVKTTPRSPSESDDEHAHSQSSSSTASPQHQVAAPTTTSVADIIGSMIESEYADDDGSNNNIDTAQFDSGLDNIDNVIDNADKDPNSNEHATVSENSLDYSSESSAPSSGSGKVVNNGVHPAYRDEPVPEAPGNQDLLGDLVNLTDNTVIDQTKGVPHLNGLEQDMELASPATDQLDIMSFDSSSPPEKAKDSCNTEVDLLNFNQSDTPTVDTLLS